MVYFCRHAYMHLIFQHMVLWHRWLKTPEQYLFGLNNSIVHGNVGAILDGVIPALAANPARRFSQVEQWYFTKWYAVQTPAVQALVQQLVEQGQLEFSNGGFVVSVCGGVICV